MFRALPRCEGPGSGGVLVSQASAGQRRLSGQEKGTDLFFALCRTPLASPLHAHAELAVDLINKPLASSELPALQGLSNEHQL